MYYPRRDEGSGKPWVSKFIAKVIDRVVSFKKSVIVIDWALVTNFRANKFQTQHFGTQCQQQPSAYVFD